MIRLSNSNKPTNPKLVKLLFVITLATVSFPEWFSTIPVEVSESTKALIHWVFKGVNLLVGLYSIYSDVEIPKHETDKH